MSEPYPEENPRTGYDLIGDVHGCAGALRGLLEQLGYARRGGTYRHRDHRRPRQALFLGDIIDRGPRIRESVLLVQAMVEAGSARIVMGNHEYHALAFHTQDTDGNWLRDHSERHIRILEATLEQFANHDADWRDSLRWFATMPLLLQPPGCRVIHACWDQAAVDTFLQRCPDAVMDAAFLRESARWGSFAAHFVKRATRGLDLRLPDGLVLLGGDGLQRRFFRCKFWVESPRTYADLEFQPDRLPPEVAQRELGDAERAQLSFYDHTQPPLFIGHYWQSGRPRRLTPNVACLDYSAVKGGRLVAYRFDGEPVLDDGKFVWVDGLR
jgi:hypothetical protein